jgi:hypothetical protein
VSRLTALLVVIVLASSALASGAAAGGVKGEPHFRGTLPVASAAHQPSPADLALIRVGARTGDRAVVEQALSHTTPAAATTASAVAPHGFAWTWAAIVALCTVGILGMGGYAYTRRTRRVGTEPAPVATPSPL